MPELLANAEDVHIEEVGQCVVIFIEKMFIQLSSTNHLSSMQREIFETAPTCLPGILTASSKRTHLGIEEVRRNIIDACALGRITSTIRRG